MDDPVEIRRNDAEGNMSTKVKMVTIRLSPEKASLLYLNIDGWMDSGACEGGLDPAEREALGETCTQIMRGLGGKLYRAPTLTNGERT